MTADYTEHIQPASKDQVALITKLADQQRKLEVQLAEQEAAVKKTKADLEKISTTTLPEAMEAAGVKTIGTNTGLSVELDEKIFASISEKNQPQAFKWLEDSGRSELIKRTFIIKFTKKQEKFADKFERDCKQRKNALPMERKKEVHAATLKKFCTEMLKSGEDFPQELFGVFRRNVSKVKAST